MLDGGDSRFPATMRLKRRNDFLAVYRNGSTWKGSCFCLHVLRREQGTRLGVVIPRSWGTAVERNRMKRLLREAFRRSALHLPSVDIIVKPTKACRETDVAGISHMLRSAVVEAMQQEVGE
jgi:ribonuclease P protein component